VSNGGGGDAYEVVVSDTFPTGVRAYWYEKYGMVTGLVFNGELLNG